MSPRRIADIGAGYSGIAAAVGLVREGAAVTLLDANRTAGGRARRVEYRGAVLDNGQHILLGAYRHTLALMRAVGVPANALRHHRLAIHYPGALELQAPSLPAGRAPDPQQGCRRVLRHAEPAGHPRKSAGPARQPHPARAARVHAARSEGGEIRGDDDAEQPEARRREGDYGARRRRGTGVVPRFQGLARRHRARVDVRAGLADGPITPDERKALIADSVVAGTYDKEVDRESAFEMLKARAGTAADASDSSAGRVTLPPWPLLESLPAALETGADRIAAFREALAAGDASLRRRPAK